MGAKLDFNPHQGDKDSAFEKYKADQTAMARAIIAGTKGPQEAVEVIVKSAMSALEDKGALNDSNRKAVERCIGAAVCLLAECYRLVATETEKESK